MTEKEEERELRMKSIEDILLNLFITVFILLSILYIMLPPLNYTP